MKIELDVKGLEVMQNLKRNTTEVMRAGFAEAGALWHRTMLPRHFTLQGQIKYGYQLRVLGYTVSEHSEKTILGAKGRQRVRGGIVVKSEPVSFNVRMKSEEGGGKPVQMTEYRLLGLKFKPLHKTGAMERAAKQSYEMRYGRGAASVVMTNLPKHAFQYRDVKDKSQSWADSYQRQPRKIQELTTVADDEVLAMAKAFERGAQRQIAIIVGGKNR